MKFISLTENLKNGVFITNHVTGKNVNLPILNNVKIEIKDKTIKLTSTDLEIGVIHTIRGKVEEEGVVTINSKTLLEYINLLPNKKTIIEKDKNDLKIECENYKTKIKGQSAEEFPLIPNVEKNNGYVLKIEDFKKALSSVVFSVSNSESKIELSGILFSINDNILTLVSTDSFRLSEKKIKIENEDKNKNENKNVKIIIPAKTIQELLRILSNLSESSEMQSGDNELKLYISENQVLFSTKSTEIVSRLIEGQYPDYKQIIPKNFKTNIIVNKNELVRAIKASSLFSKNKIDDVNLDFPEGKNQVIVSSISGEIGENTVNLEAKVTGVDNSVVINYRYVLDGLKVINSNEVRIKIVNSETPCIIESINNDEYIYIIMPIKQ